MNNRNSTQSRGPCGTPLQFFISLHLPPTYLVQFHKSCFLFPPYFSLSLLLVPHSIFSHNHRLPCKLFRFHFQCLSLLFQILLILLALFQSSCCFPPSFQLFFLDTLSIPFVQFISTLHGLFEAIPHTFPPPEIPFVALCDLCCCCFNCVAAFVECFFILHMAQHSFTSPRQKMRIIVVERVHISCITSHTHALR